MNELKLFNSSEFGEVRVVMSAENEPLFCLADVCQTLGLNPSKVAQRLTEGVLSKYTLMTAGGEQTLNFVNEDGLYDTILDSRKKKAKMFRKWVTSEVLPSIRKTGSYSVPHPQSLTPAEMFLQNAQLMVEQERRIKQIESRLDAMESERKETIKQLSNAPLSKEEVPEITLRNRVRQLVNKYAVAHNIRQDFVWNKVYEQLFYIYGVSIRKYKREKGETLLDVAERHNHVEKMYAIISGMINADKKSAN